MAKPVLETPRLVVRWPEHRDVERLVRLYTDAEVMRFMGGARDAAAMRDAFGGLVAEPDNDEERFWVLEERSVGFAGCSALIRKEIEGTTEYELVYTLARRAWGRGLAGEAAAALARHALDTLDKPRIVSLIEPEHAASARVAEKAGMRLERVVIRPGGRSMRLYARDA